MLVLMLVYENDTNLDYGDEFNMYIMTISPCFQEALEGDEEAPLTNGFHEDDAPVRIPRPSSAKGARRRPEPPNADPGITSSKLEDRML